MWKSLSPMENLLLHSRLEKIKNGIQKDYSSLLKIEAEASIEGNPLTTPIPISMTYIFPGAGGVDDLILELRATIPESVIIDWKEYRGNILTASYDSEVVGQAIAELILNSNKNNDNSNRNSNSNNSIHFIGISVGAFAANAAATEIYRQQQACQKQNVDIDINLTLLDPFCGRGIFQLNYGGNNFGKYATSALQILNTDDPVPTTNDPLPYCYCLDVTNSSKRKDFVPPPGDSMHSWPLAYFIRHYQSYSKNKRSNKIHDDDGFPRGTVEKVA